MALEHGQNGRPPVSAAPISRVVAVINPLSGAGLDSSAATSGVAIVRESLARVGLTPTVHVTERAGHARELAAAAVRDGADLVIVWGGDGTFNEVASALVGSATPPGSSLRGRATGLQRHSAYRAHRRRRCSTCCPRRRARSTSARSQAGRFSTSPASASTRTSPDSSTSAVEAGAASGRTSRSAFARAGRTRRAGTTWSSTAIAARSPRCSWPSPTVAEYGMGACISPGALLDDGWLDATIVEDRPAVVRFLDARHLATRTIGRARRVLLRQVRSAIVTGGGTDAVSPRRRAWRDRGYVEIGMMPGALRVRA